MLPSFEPSGVLYDNTNAQPFFYDQKSQELLTGVIDESRFSFVFTPHEVLRKWFEPDKLNVEDKDIRSYERQLKLDLLRRSKVEEAKRSNKTDTDNEAFFRKPKMDDSTIDPQKIHKIHFSKASCAKKVSCHEAGMVPKKETATVHKTKRVKFEESVPVLPTASIKKEPAAPTNKTAIINPAKKRVPAIDYNRLQFERCFPINRRAQ
ncbi:hypothetical_protein [Candidozyma auris]|uniref:hypothetical_protein n=1 Tax=Candidozyma auris TaxID=498019 RepID=UPI000D2AD805|nr:hypothetical_protein [[Candida] auris]QEO20371.1 hypothetical_protein [[Candida] auris]GBL49658.1 hypothetical protein CAJCM15448_19320 [[Candida] auris]